MFLQAGGGQLTEVSDDPPSSRPPFPVKPEAIETRAKWLERVVLPHEPIIRKRLSRKCGALDIDDVLQATYLRLLATESVAQIKDIKSYVYRTAMSVIIEHARREQIATFECVDFKTVDYPADEPTAECAIDSGRALDHFYDALNQLPPKQRMIVELRRIEGLCVRATAQQLETSISSVEKLQNRAMRQLLAAMTQFDPGICASIAGRSFPRAL